MILLLWLLNFGVSWLNAWGCGKSWNETKAAGGMSRFMIWMGATMAAIGFTWCYMVIIGFVGASFPVEGDNGVKAPLLSFEQLDAFMNLGYLCIIFPLLGSGIAITIHSWIEFWRRRDLASGLTAGWNTFAQVHNAYGAVKHVPGAFDKVGDFFKGSDKKGQTLVIGLVILAAAGGIITTWAIIRSVAKSTAYERSLKYADRA